MNLHIYGGVSRYEPENICRLFLPHESVTLCDGETANGIYIAAGVNGNEATARLVFDRFDRTLNAPVVDNDPLLALWGKPAEFTVSKLLYTLFCELFRTTQPWGMLTGVRPVKLLRRLTAEVGLDEACRYFRETLLVSEQKTALAAATLHAENAVLALSAPSSCSVYISIPFCPSRCAYCSFVSQTTERSQYLIPEYVNLLCREVEETGKLIRRLGLRLDSIYIGGGTPTTLNAAQLTQLMQTVSANLDLSQVKEYTVEAGRPDTVTRDKLEAILQNGATRLSINPQTLDDEVLRTIGRRHTTDEFLSAFALAREVGFTHINADLIAGLPGDTLDGFSRSLSGVAALSPESITVHTLSMKRASHLVIQGRDDYDAGGDTPQMVSGAVDTLTGLGYHSYYLYRQSRCVGNQENTGWAKDGHDGLYNVFMMDETHTVLGCGAGAVTKLKAPHSDYIERIFNFKFPYEYVDRFDEMLKRKQQVVTFYDQHGIGRHS